MAKYREFIVVTILIATLTFARSVHGQILPGIDIPGIDLPGIEDPTPTPEPQQPPQQDPQPEETPSPEPQQPPAEQQPSQNEEPQNNTQGNNESNNEGSSVTPQEEIRPTDIPFFGRLFEESKPEASKSATPSPTLKPVKKSSPVVFSYSDVARPVTAAFILLLIALAAVLLKSRDTIFKALLKYLKLLKKKLRKQ